jgi:DNA-directed RNA polymerase specialized sigma24 family protein
MSQAVEQALELIRENQPESTDRALALLQNTVYSFSMKVCGHPQDAEDTMQDVLLKSIPYLAKFDNPRRSPYGCTRLRATAASAAIAAASTRPPRTYRWTN